MREGFYVRERNYSFDFLKGLGCIGIICIHSAVFIGVIKDINFIINTLARFAVPIFFTVSGYFFFKNIKKEGYFKKYIVKLIKIYVFSLIAYLGMDLIFRGTAPGMPIFLSEINSGRINILEIIFIAFFIGGLSFSSYAMWYILSFIYGIIIIYFICRKDVSRIKWVLLISFTLNILGLFGTGQSYNVFFKYPSLTTRETLHFALFYLSLGSYIATQKEENPQKNYSIKYLGFSILFSILMLLERWILVYKFNATWGDYYIFTIPMIYYLFKFALNYRGFKKNNIFVKMGEKSLGIYLIHTIAISFVQMLSIKISPSAMNSILYNIILVPLVAFISYKLANISSRINKNKMTSE